MTVPFVDLAGGREYTWLASAARIASPSDTDIKAPYDADGVEIVIDVTAITTACSLTFTLQGFDPTSGKTWTVATMATLTATGTVVLRVHPNDATAAISGGVQTQQGQLPPHLRLHMVQGNANSTTYSVGLGFTG